LLFFRLLLKHVSCVAQQKSVEVIIGNYTFTFSGKQSLGPNLRFWPAVTIARSFRPTVSFDCPCEVNVRRKDARDLVLKQEDLWLISVGIDDSVEAGSEESVCGIILCPASSQAAVDRDFQLKLPLLWLTKSWSIDPVRWPKKAATQKLLEAAKRITAGDLLSAEDVMGANYAETQRTDPEAVAAREREAKSRGSSLKRSPRRSAVSAKPKRRSSRPPSKRLSE
jgi:hypothetical protein